MKRFDDLLDTSRAIDTEEAYRDMLRECYSQDLNGPFASMDPAEILEKMDPVAYRCGHGDYIDSQDWTEYGSDNYETDYLEEVREECESAIADEVEELEEAKEDLESELEDLADSTPDSYIEARITAIRENLVTIDRNLALLDEELQQLAKLF